MSAISLEGRESSTRDVLVWKWSLTPRLVCEGWRVIAAVVVVAVIAVGITGFGRRWGSEGSAASQCGFWGGRSEKHRVVNALGGWSPISQCGGALSDRAALCPLGRSRSVSPPSTHTWLCQGGLGWL